jgi:hypothetical protein
MKGFEDDLLLLLLDLSLGFKYFQMEENHHLCRLIKGPHQSKPDNGQSNFLQCLVCVCVCVCVCVY